MRDEFVIGQEFFHGWNLTTEKLTVDNPDSHREQLTKPSDNIKNPETDLRQLNVESDSARMLQPLSTVNCQLLMHAVVLGNPPNLHRIPISLENRTSFSKFDSLINRLCLDDHISANGFLDVAKRT